jgi:ribosomal protein S27AE
MGLFKSKEERKRIWEEKNKRKCINCGFIGGMKFYLETNKGSFIQLIMLLLFFFPGLIYWVIMRGKKICPKCQSTNTAIV